MLFVQLGFSEHAKSCHTRASLAMKIFDQQFQFSWTLDQTILWHLRFSEPIYFEANSWEVNVFIEQWSQLQLHETSSELFAHYLVAAAFYLHLQVSGSRTFGAGHLRLFLQPHLHVTGSTDWPSRQLITAKLQTQLQFLSRVLLIVQRRVHGFEIFSSAVARFKVMSGKINFKLKNLSVLKVLTKSQQSKDCNNAEFHGRLLFQTTSKLEW